MRKIKIWEFWNLVLLTIQPIAEILRKKIEKINKKLILKKIGKHAKIKIYFFFCNFFFPKIFLCQKTMWQAILECRWARTSEARVLNPTASEASQLRNNVATEQRSEIFFFLKFIHVFVRFKTLRTICNHLKKNFFFWILTKIHDGDHACFQNPKKKKFF